MENRGTVVRLSTGAREFSLQYGSEVHPAFCSLNTAGGGGGFIWGKAELCSQQVPSVRMCEANLIVFALIFLLIFILLHVMEKNAAI
jgi:hypothetical protein